MDSDRKLWVLFYILQSVIISKDARQSSINAPKAAPSAITRVSLLPVFFIIFMVQYQRMIR